MVLATDELVRKSYTGTVQATLQPLVPQIWAAHIEKNLRKRAVFEQSVVVNTDLLVPNAGDKVYIPILPDLGALSSLTEGTDMPVTSLNNASSITLQPIEYGQMLGITRKAMDRFKYDAVAEIMDRLSYAMSLRIETNIASLFSASVPGTSNSMTALYANGKATGTITTSDTFNDALILNGVSQLWATNNIPFPDGYFRLYINPAQYTALLQDQNTRNDLRWAAPERLLNGEVGALHGCRIIVTNYIQTTSEGSGGTVTVNNAMLLAPRWAAIAYKRRPEAFVDPTLYDGGRRRQFGITADFDAELIHNERGVVLKSA